MSDLAISCVIFTAVFAGTLVGAWLRTGLPDHHLSADSRDAMKLAIGLIGTMAALVLGLMVAAAKSSYDTQKNEITQMSTKFILLDRTLSNYGAEAKHIREQLHEAVQRALIQVWLDEGSATAREAPVVIESVHHLTRNLVPTTDAQRSAKARALTLAADLEEMRWLLYEQAGSSISMPFLVVLVVWLTIIFAGFGLLAPSNWTALGTLFLCAVCVSSSILLILELDRPFGGLMQISDAPVRNTLELLGRP